MDLVADVEGELAGEHIPGFVLAVVHVERWFRQLGHDRLEHRVAVAGLGDTGLGLEPAAECPESPTHVSYPLLSSSAWTRPQITSIACSCFSPA